MKSMYKIIFAIFMLSVKYSLAQAPQLISYQAIARDNAGNLISNQLISLKFSIHDVSSNGTIVYSETHSVNTNEFGSFNVNIGSGNIVSGVFSGINWSLNAKYLQVEMDITGGASYTDMGTQQMLSVPYSLYSSKSGGSAGGDLTGNYPNPVVSKINGSPLGTTSGAGIGDVLKWNGSNWSTGTDNTSGSSASWSLTGNTGIIDGTHFIGTTNNAPLNFVVNNQKSGRIDNVLFNTFFGYRSGKSVTGSFNTALGYDALFTQTNGANNTAIGYNSLYSSSSAYDNTAIGFNSLYSLSTGFQNTALGSMALNANTGNDNTATGYSALAGNTGGSGNTANGVYSLYSNTTGTNNTAVGVDALRFTTDGFANTALGSNALRNNVNGTTNVAIGSNALITNTGTNNIAIGAAAGQSLTNGNSNIMIGNPGIAGDALRIRIGSTGIQSSCFIAGINGAAVSGGVNVLVNTSGQLGTILSSAKFKRDINNMGNLSSNIYKLRPVTFYYKDEYANGDNSLQYGLIAEETEKIFPDLVARDADGNIFTVRYHLLTPLMLNELLKEHSLNAEQSEIISKLQMEIEKLKKENNELKDFQSNMSADIEKIKSQLSLTMKAEK